MGSYTQERYIWVHPMPPCGASPAFVTTSGALRPTRCVWLLLKIGHFHF